MPLHTVDLGRYSSCSQAAAGASGPTRHAALSPRKCRPGVAWRWACRGSTRSDQSRIHRTPLLRPKRKL